MAILLFFVLHWYLSLFSQTFFQHRYAAHGAFKMNKVWERIFFIFVYITQGSSYMSARAYAIMHRMHHAYTDTEKDPHSPSYSSNVFTMMWRSRNFYKSIFKGTMLPEDRFVKNLPEWDWFDRMASSGVSRITWVVLYIAFYVQFAVTPWLYLLIPIHAAMGAVHGAIINWFAHKFGYTNYKLKNTSQNLLHVDIIMLGESYHNNHHKHPSNINFGQRWYELDPVYPIIKLFHYMRIIKITKPVAATVLQEA